MTILVPISPGELLDKWSILRIKASRFTDETKLLNVDKELGVLSPLVFDLEVGVQGEEAAKLDELIMLLAETNVRLWDVEEAIRQPSCDKDDIVEFSCQIIDLNDYRSDLKRQINALLNSDIVEEKDYHA